MLQTIKDLAGLFWLALKTPEPQPDIETLGDLGVWPKDSDLKDKPEDTLARMIREDREYYARFGEDQG